MMNIVADDAGDSASSSRSDTRPSSSPAAPAGDSPVGNRLLIVDDCTLFRETLAAALVDKGIGVSALAWDLPTLVAAFDDVGADLVLLNISTSGSDLLLRAVMDIAPNAGVIVLGTSDDDEAEIILCAEAGVAGYLMRSDTIDDLVILIRNVAAGRNMCPPQVSAVLLRRFSALASPLHPTGRSLALTAREAQILRLLELGRSNRDIAARLDIAVHTVKNHVHNLLTKLRVSTRAEAAALSRSFRPERDLWAD
jgi:DNA-binding NarL/FixJ family response regulator